MVEITGPPQPPWESTASIAHAMRPDDGVDVSSPGFSPATPDDLRWWLALAPTLEWTWARTYADSAPHWYVVLGRTEGVTREDFISAGRVIRTFGEAGKFYSATNLYLYTGYRRLKFWCMWADEPSDEDATLINLATTDRTYGEQRDFDMDRVHRLRGQGSR